MNLLLFITVIVVSFVVVRIGAIAFQLTGLEWSMAKFQALSCFTSTGFTTKEAELVTSDRQRRRIASILIVLGHAGLVTMIATLANSLEAKSAIEERLSTSFLPFDLPQWLVPILNLGVLLVCAFALYRVLTNTEFSRRFTRYLRKKMIKRELVSRVTFQELLIATGGYGVTRVAVSAGSPVLGKQLSKSELRSYDITVLAIVRGSETIPNPEASRKILAGDELICFGKLENIRNRICMNP